MKSRIILVMICFLSITTWAQDSLKLPREMHGTKINFGTGFGYYGYQGYVSPALVLGAEMDAFRNITLGPFIGYYTNDDKYYTGSSIAPYKYYSYRETIIPTGIKATYYFDEVLNAGLKWDFYAATSLGLVFHSVTWEDNYDGKKNVINGPSTLFGSAHIGARWRAESKIGFFLDLSTAFSTFGISFKL